MAVLAAQLYNAVDCGNSNELQRLIDNGADVDQCYDNYSHRKSILHFACGKGRIDCVKILLDHGASVSIRDKWRMPPIMYCISTNYLDIAHMLIEKDRKTVDAQDMHGRSSLHVAVEDGSETAINLLLQSGCDVNIQTFNGISPLMLLMSSKDIDSYFPLMKMLLESGANVNLKSFRDNRTALHLASITKKVDAVEYLLKLNADPNHVDTSGKTPLTNLLDHHVPIYQHRPKITDDVMCTAVLLTQAGADMNLTTTELSNPLIMAEHVKCHQMVRLFLDHGADVNMRFPYSRLTPLVMAIQQKDIDIVRVLIDWNCRFDLTGRCFRQGDYYDISPFALAIRQGSWDIVKLMVLHGYNVSTLSYLKDSIIVSDVPLTLKNNPEMLHFLSYYASHPASLVNLCTLIIFKAIRSNISNKIKLLPLPSSIKEHMVSYYFDKSRQNSKLNLHFQLAPKLQISINV